MKTSYAFDRREIAVFIPPFGSVLISINDAGYGPPEGINTTLWKDTLILHFEDIVDPSVARSIKPKHASEITDFIYQHWNLNIYVHCAGGISRSAGIVAVLELLGWEVKWNVRHYPNVLVINTLIKELIKRPGFSEHIRDKIVSRTQILFFGES